jgi:hypothetical protein
MNRRLERGDSKSARRRGIDRGPQPRDGGSVEFIGQKQAFNALADSVRTLRSGALRENVVSAWRGDGTRGAERGACQDSSHDTARNDYVLKCGGA